MIVCRGSFRASFLVSKRIVRTHAQDGKPCLLLCAVLHLTDRPNILVYNDTRISLTLKAMIGQKVFFMCSVSLSPFDFDEQLRSKIARKKVQVASYSQTRIHPT